jgi:hypothetical protein
MHGFRVPSTDLECTEFQLVFCPPYMRRCVCACKYNIYWSTSDLLFWNRSCPTLSAGWSGSYQYLMPQYIKRRFMDFQASVPLAGHTTYFDRCMFCLHFVRHWKGFYFFQPRHRNCLGCNYFMQRVVSTNFQWKFLPLEFGTRQIQHQFGVILFRNHLYRKIVAPWPSHNFISIHVSPTFPFLPPTTATQPNWEKRAC